MTINNFYKNLRLVLRQIAIRSLLAAPLKKK
nr:MAG TPA: hypothetical protein [Caudoviricetes sp.]